MDLGTGNGHLLFQMQQEFDHQLQEQLSYTMKGIDYSSDSIRFANTINQEKYHLQQLSFDQADLLLKSDAFIQLHHGKFDILLDKGTLDAIALNQDLIPEFDNQIGMDIYPHQVKKLMHQKSILLVTSCNFTRSELIRIITPSGLQVWDQIEYPTFEFGGAKGSTICSIAFIWP